MPKLSPCYRCENRARNCHSDCERYKAYKNERAERQALRIKALKDDYYYGYLKPRAIKYKKTQNYKDKRKGK